MAQHVQPLPVVAPASPTVASLDKPSENHAFLLGVVLSILAVWAASLYVVAIS